MRSINIICYDIDGAYFGYQQQLLKEFDILPRDNALPHIETCEFLYIGQ